MPNVIIIVQINKQMNTVILRYCGPFYDVPKHVYEVPKLRAFSRTSENGAQITVFIGRFFGQLPKFDISETVGPNDLKFEVRIVLDWFLFKLNVKLFG